jgi:hypothetical protein
VKKYLVLLLCTVAVIVFCSQKDKTSRFSEYLRAAKDLRTRIDDPRVFRDSLKAIQKEYGIDEAQEFSRLRGDPSEWIVLLRKLKHE